MLYADISARLFLTRLFLNVAEPAQAGRYRCALGRVAGGRGDAVVEYTGEVRHIGCESMRCGCESGMQGLSRSDPDSVIKGQMFRLTN